MDAQIVGRDEELAAVAAFVGSLPGGSTGLVLDGEAGAGKTTLWLAGVAAAREHGFVVLEARPALAEAQLAFAGLGDLLGEVLDDVLPYLPEPQADALRAALLLERPHGAAPSERTVGAAMLSALRTLAATRPVLIAIDDVQWLDTPSASVLGYAWRRLRADAVGLLVTRRAGEPAPAALIDSEESERIEVGPLTIGALHRLLQARLGLVLSRPTLRRVHEVTLGNPFFALELARALQRGGAAPTPGEPLPVPERLRELVRARLGALPDPTRHALAVVAALGRPTLAVVTAAIDSGEDALRPSLEAHVLELDGERLRFAHPLLAAAAYEDREPLERRALHRRLAELVEDEEEEARHLALAAEGPDPIVADALERAAAHARSRGATASAAELCEQARMLTPPEQIADIHRRTVVAARYLFIGGDAERAKSMLEEAIASAPPGATRAEALVDLARVQIYRGDPRDAAELFRQALAEGGGNLLLQALAARGVAVALLFLLEDLETAYEHAAHAADLALRAGDQALQVGALGSKGYLEGLLGRAEAAATLGIAVASEDANARLDDRGTGSPRFIRAELQLETDDSAGAAAAFRTLRDESLAAGNEGSLPHVLAELARAEYLSGNWSEAKRVAEEAYEWAVQTGQRNQQAFSLSVRALVVASLGLETEARTDAEAALALAGEGQVYARIASARALGVLELSLERPRETVRVLAPLRKRLLAGGVRDPGTVRFIPDEVEALIVLGRLDDAEAVLGWFEQQARALDRASALAAAARCRGLLATARGDTDGALEELERALTQHERVEMPFERLRTLLVLGATQRRAKHRADARATLEATIAGFEKLGAALWTKRARAELARVSGRAPAGGGLTATERRVAELVAEGRSNKEVASVLFVTPKTVGVTLSRIYAKLGIHSRMELARRLPKL